MEEEPGAAACVLAAEVASAVRQLPVAELAGMVQALSGAPLPE